MLFITDNRHSKKVLPHGDRHRRRRIRRTLVAAHLLRQGASPLTVRLVERASSQFSRGVAYSTIRDCHFLNVPAAKISAFPDDADHFLRWAKARNDTAIDPPWVTAITPTSFLPRRAYGDYLYEVLHEAERQAPAGVRLERTIGEVIGLSLAPRGVRLCMAGGERALEAQQAVLALGNFQPGDPNVANRSFYESDRYYGDPWGPEVLAALMETRSCLAIGSGLTMADWAITLSEAGYRGTLHVLSRRGMWPHASPGCTGRFQPHCGYFAPDGSWLVAPDPPLHPIPGLRLARRHRCPTAGHTGLVGEPATAGATTLPAPPAPLLGLSPAPARTCCRRAPGGASRIGAVGPPCRSRHGLSGGRERRRCGHQAARTRWGRFAPRRCRGELLRLRKRLPQAGKLFDQRTAGPGLGPSGPLGSRACHRCERGVAQHRRLRFTLLYTLGPPEKGMLWETTAVPELAA